MEEYLPVRITKMIVELHRRGYTSVYLYCGMSASGGHWRYIIGLLEDGKWPARNHIVSGSVGREGEVEWAYEPSDAHSLADCFVNKYSSILSDAKGEPTEYSQWFKDVVDGLGHNELLVFYADYSARHEKLLKNAPGYSR